MYNEIRPVTTNEIYRAEQVFPNGRTRVIGTFCTPIEKFRPALETINGGGIVNIYKRYGKVVRASFPVIGPKN